MISAFVLSMISATLSLLAFYLARRPFGWMKLWRPDREFMSVEYLSPRRRRFLVNIRVRATLAGILLLIFAILLPVLDATSFQILRRASGQSPETKISQNTSGE